MKSPSAKSQRIPAGRLNSRRQSQAKGGSFGFNAQSEQYEDLLESGVIDPAKVTRLALQNAASVAGLMLTTNVMIAEKPREKESHAMPGGGMPPGGMY